MVTDKITEIRFAWRDRQFNVFNVFFTREDGSQCVIVVNAPDELGAYVEATRRLDRTS